MLRPTSRRGRFSAALFVISLVATLLVPVGALARGVDAPAGSLVSDAPPAERTPKVEGRGIQDAEAGRGQTPKVPLQTLDFVPGRTPTAATSDGPVVVTAAPGAALASLSAQPKVTSFGPWAGFDQAGAGATCTNSQNCGEREPPDSSVAVGPNDVVQAVNTDFRFTNREGTITKPALDAYEFFQVATFTFDDQPVTIDGISDARWIYDAKHDRWLGTVTAWHCDDDGALTGDEPYGFVLAALSTSGNPAGSYYQFSVLYDFLPVGPMVGTSADKLVISASEYALSSSTCAAGTLVKDTPSLLTLSWADLMTFPAAPLSQYSLIGLSPSSYEAPRPAIAPKGTSNTIFGVVANDTTPTTSNIVSFRITGSLTAATNTIAVSLVDITAAEVVPPLQSPPAPVQPPGATLPSAVTRHPTHAIWQDNVLSFASTYPCNPAGAGIRACARVTQLNTATATPTRIQDTLIGTAGSDTWTPGIAQSQSGALHVVYTQSSSSAGMSSYATYQLPSDPLNTFHEPLELADGGATHYNGSRWGDFTMPAQDPRDTNAVWQGNQYTKSDGKWATRVSELQTPGATFVAIPPVRLLDTRLDAGLVGMFSANTSRPLVVGGRGGIPANAIAVTGNLTVTGQTGPGYLSVTPTPNTSPSTSTLNFPLGDTRANNFTSPLAKDRTLSIYFNAASGRKTHVILDVTGYFLDGATGATYVPLGEPVRNLDTRDGTGGLTGKFVHGIVRKWQVDGPTGVVPTTAIAVTGNLTITGQTTRGVASLGPTVASDPATSTLNAPVGDNRANGITVGLAADGTLSAVFRGTTAGASAHLIFDVTGYYVPGTSGARFVPVSPGRRLDTRIGLGLPGPFAGGVARTLDIEPFQGVPANATAITGNLTVVNQTKAGFLAMTALADNTPETSTLNFPTGDTRANGVTGPLSAAGTVGLVYFTGSASGTTHAILDITGYFR